MGLTPVAVRIPSWERGTSAPPRIKSMESITACALSLLRAISVASVSGGMAGASLPFTDDARRVIPHDATERRVNRRIPSRFILAKVAKSF